MKVIPATSNDSIAEQALHRVCSGRTLMFTLVHQTQEMQFYEYAWKRCASQDVLTDQCSCARYGCCRWLVKGQSTVSAWGVGAEERQAEVVGQSPLHLASPAAGFGRWTGTESRGNEQRFPCQLPPTPSVCQNTITTLQFTGSTAWGDTSPHFSLCRHLWHLVSAPTVPHSPSPEFVPNFLDHSYAPGGQM